jgi:hypothetical protein
MQSDEEKRVTERARWHRRIQNPAYAARHRAQARARRKLLRATSPEFREGQRTRQRDAYHSDPKQRLRMLSANDRYRRNNWEKIKARRRQQRAERRQSDPEYRERIRLQKRTQSRRHSRQVRRVREMALMELVRASIPPSYPPHVRDDIAGEMHLAIIEHRLRPSDVVARVGEFSRAYWRAHSRYETVSLDAEVYPGGPALIDTLAAPD